MGVSAAQSIVGKSPLNREIPLASTIIAVSAKN